MKTYPSNHVIIYTFVWVHITAQHRPAGTLWPGQRGAGERI